MMKESLSTIPRSSCTIPNRDVEILEFKTFIGEVLERLDQYGPFLKLA